MPEIPVVRWPTGPGQDKVVQEEPLEIRIEGKPLAVTLRSPGQDEELVYGFLWTSGVIDGSDDIRAMALVGPNTLDVRLSEGVKPKLLLDRTLFASSACGLCGSTSLERLYHASGKVAGWVPTPEVVAAAISALRQHQPIFLETGGCHGAALLDEQGSVSLVREDVGRHNALDKVLGAALMQEQPVRGVVVSSRAGFELVQKAWVAGAGVLVAAGAPTELAIQAAKQAGMCLIGWAGTQRFVQYASP
jgi:FdhD protein